MTSDLDGQPTPTTEAAVAGSRSSMGRLRRGITEFLALPLLIAGGFCVAAVLVVLMGTWGSTSALRDATGKMIPPSGATEVLGVIAASLMTITSITFTVLLIAVQQTSSSLGAVVFDQYLRRRSNQLYVGYFVGATAFSFIVFVFSGSGTAPVLGAFFALVLTVGSLVVLLLLIHSTVDQMRPECVAESIHRLAIQAHQRELRLMDRTRRQRRSSAEAECRDVATVSGGYVIGIDARALAAVAESVGPETEIFLPCQMGTYLEAGATVAQIVGANATDDRYDKDVLSAFALDNTRRVEVDSGYSIDQLENVAWMTVTSAQSPSAAGAAIHQLRDLVSRWAIIEGRASKDAAEAELLPVVYTDGAVDRVLIGYGNILTATSQSRQSDTAALLLTSFAHALPRLDSERHQDALIQSLNAALPSVTSHVNSPGLAEALTRLVAALDDAGHDSHSVQHVQTVLRTATERLQPDRSTHRNRPG